MLKKLDKKEFEKYADWAYGIALDRTRSCYPTYTDGIKTKEDFFNTAYKAFDGKTDEILLFAQNNKVCGWIHYFALADDKYIGVHSFNIECGTKTALKEFEEFCGKKFKGFELYAGFPEKNVDAISYFKENGYTLLETSLPTVFHFKEPIKYATSPHLEKIEKGTYGKFDALHRQNDGDMYWTGERILKTFGNWLIFYYDDKQTQGTIYIQNCDNLHEIFGVDFSENQFNPTVFSELIKKCLTHLSEIGAKHLYYFAEENEIKILMDLGFEILGGYCCYQKKMA